MDSMEQKRQEEEGKKEKKPYKTKPNCTHIHQEREKGESEQWLAADFGQRGH